MPAVAKVDKIRLAWSSKLPANAALIHPEVLAKTRAPSSLRGQAILPKAIRRKLGVHPGRANPSLSDAFHSPCLSRVLRRCPGRASEADWMTWPPAASRVIESRDRGHSWATRGGAWIPRWPTVGRATAAPRPISPATASRAPPILPAAGQWILRGRDPHKRLR